MAILKRSEILKAVDIKHEEVEVPEWNGSVMVYGLSGSERGSFDATVIELKDGKSVIRMQDICAKLCALSIRDEDGRRLFDDDEIDLLGKKSAQALARVFEVAQRLAGLAEGDVESLVKNSGSDQSDDSGSG